MKTDTIKNSEKKEQKGLKRSFLSASSFLAIPLLLAGSAFAEKPFPDIENYNEGVGLYRAKDFHASEKAFATAIAQTDDQALKQKALYNRGTALLASCTDEKHILPDQQLDARIAATAQAEKLFEQALTLLPDDMAAKQNLERAVNLKEQLEQQKEQQKQQQSQDQNQQDQEQQPNSSDPPDKSDQQQENKEQPKDEQDQNQQQQNPSQNKPHQQAGAMNEEEAQQLLDAMKQDEQDQRAHLKPYLGHPVRVSKDW